MGLLLGLLISLLLPPGLAAEAANNDAIKKNIPLGVIRKELLPVGYPSKETLTYDVSWTGGIKIGELHLEQAKRTGAGDEYELKALVSTQNGALNLIYPIVDRYTTWVRGPKKLPFRYESWQKEGFRYRSYKIMYFDQEKGVIQTRKNDHPERVYKINGEANNEFSSFFNSRLMDFSPGNLFIVPTFADKKRAEVVVHVMAAEVLQKTVLGDVATKKIMPIMQFKGLYDKKGDTVIWYTDDECRVPVRVVSQLMIGSLTADLTGFDNAACKRYPAVHPPAKNK